MVIAQAKERGRGWKVVERKIGRWQLVGRGGFKRERERKGETARERQRDHRERNTDKGGN